MRTLQEMYRANLKPVLFLALILAMANAKAQNTTNYQEIPLKSTPITVKERKEVQAEGGKQDNTNLPTSKTFSAVSGGSGSTAISETTGALSVSLTGGASYSVPIMVPPGINGVVPTIAISYNSQGGNGLAGYGWNVTGISVISRIPSTKFHDNNIDPVDFDNLDRFALDGQRLVLKSGTYGANEAQYETENYSNLKVRSFGVSSFGASYGPQYFRVDYPDGSFALYGAESNSRSRTDYAISYWQNPQGLRVDYTYTTADNSLAVSSIKYGHKVGFTPTSTINFKYKPRKRPEQSFIAGVDFKRKNILYEINVIGGTTPYRNYSLTHDFNTLGYERLTGITEKTGDNTLSHSPITFSYTNTSTTVGHSANTTNLTELNVSGIAQNTATVVPLDVDADGKMDFIVYPNPRSARTKLWLFNDLNSGENNIGQTIENLPIYESVFPMAYLNASNKLEGGQGFGLITHTGTSSVAFKVNGASETTGYSQFYERIWPSPTYSTQTNCGQPSGTNRVPQRYISGDFNGDGLTDAIAIGMAYSYANCTGVVSPPGPCFCSSGTYNASPVTFINLDRRLTTGFYNTAGTLAVPLVNNQPLIAADVNGDGKTDILQFTAGNVYAYTLSASNSLQLLWTTPDTRIKTEYQPMIGDYNGDGKTDFMMPTAANSSTFALFRSTGSQFVKTESAYPFTFKLSTTATSPVSTFNLVPSDINGDGRTDILEYRTVTNNNGLNGTQALLTYYNTFSTATDVAPAFTYMNTAAIPAGPLYHFPIPVFLTSADRPNGNLDFATISNNRVFTFSFAKDNRTDMLLNSISNNGVTQTITYRDMVKGEKGLDNITVYHPLINQVYPYVDIGVARGTKLVAALARTASGTTAIRQVFSYEGAVAHADGLGFMGFTGLARSEWNTGDTDRIWNITKHDIARRGAVTSAYTLPYTVNFVSIPSDYITKTSFVNASTLAANKMFKLTNTSNLVQNRLELTSISTSYVYDAYTNPTKITVDYSGQGSSVTDLTYGNSTGSTYYIGRPLTKKNTTTINGNPFSTEEQYTYTGYLVQTRLTKGNGTQFDTETFTHDTFGNIIKKVTTPYGTALREVVFTYDTSGRYLLTSKDVEGLVTTFVYNIATGTLARETNPYGLATQYFYDKWDRLIKVTDYLNKNANTTYVESSNSYTVTVSADDGGSAIAVYDPLKRLVKQSNKDVLGQWVSTSYQYDKFDRTFKVSEPYIGTAASQWNTTEYDFYGRPNKLTAHTGRVTTITYSNQSVIVNDGTKTVTTTKNALGNVTKVVDPGGAIDYTYYGNGALKTSTYGGITITTEQDGWGRKTKLIDPSAGTYTYTYNGFGEPTKETTPKGSTEYTYSALGKLTQKKVTGDAATNMVINYTYDPATKLPKTVALATNGDGNTGTTTFFYDAKQRVTSTVEAGSNATFTKTYVYDGFGRVDTEESEGRLKSNNKFSKVKVKNTYANGQLKTVKDFTSSEELWNITGLNARGQVTTSTMGVGMRRTNSYDAFGYLTQALAQKNVTTSAVEVMKLTYSFNTQKGTLTSRTNGMFAWNESFTYDNQDRLLTFNDNSGAKSQSYDTKGRIDVNSLIGQYKYSTTNFQQTELALNPAGQAYYNNYTAQNITYNSFKSPVEINENGKDRVSFQYNAGQGRASMFYGDTNADRLQRRYRRHYSQDGSMEVTFDKTTGKTTFVTYIGGDGYSSPVIYHNEQTSGTTAQYLYLHRDYLGSILAITDKNGNFREKRHFDAWGNIVKLTDGNNVALTKFAVLDRGYTGHEHLQGVGLVHMNGRLYDPMLHRFLMPDNFVQDPYSSLSYNRYGYVMNNPLMYTDANGEFFWAAVIIGAVVGAVTQAVKPGANFGTIVGGGLIGAAAGLVGAGVGSVVAGGGFFSSGVATTMGFWSGAASGAAGGFAGGFVGTTGTAWLNGANFGRGLKAGLKDGLVSGITGGLVNGITSGIRAAKKGLGFFNGVANPKNSISASGMAVPKKVPVVYAEGDYLDWTGTAAGPDGDSVFRLGRANVDYTFRVSERVFDLETTLRVNGAEIGGMLQNLGDGMALAGYGLTLSVVGAEFGVPLYGIGSGVSFGGTMLESVATANWQQGGTAIGGFALDRGSKILINRIVPGSEHYYKLTRHVLGQSTGLKINLIEKFINNN